MTKPEAGETGSKPLEKYSISQHIARILCRQKWHLQTNGARWRHEANGANEPLYLSVMISISWLPAAPHDGLTF